jgi:DNA-binding response OmpR family regulator
MGRRILLVEHDRRVALTLEQTLASVHAHVVGRATHLEDALRKTLTLAPDVVLVDVAIPGDGLQLARTIATHGDVPVVFLVRDAATAERVSGHGLCVRVDVGVAELAVSIDLACRLPRERAGLATASV